MRCPSCGNQNRDEATFCDSCGTKLEQPESESATAAAQPPAAPSASLPDGVPDRVAGHLEMVSFLGRGGRKEVYLAHDASASGREVAVALFETAGLGEAALARARREMQAMERLGEHPHLVPVLETGEQGGRPYIVSPYMAGGDVKQQLASAEGGRLEIERAVRIGIDVCRALEHAHSCGIVHRDLKPANVWLDEDGRARLGDFGLAASGPGRGGSLVGTVAYLPPEQALGRSTGPRSDLYSLGALLYEMVCGSPPFTGSDAVSVIGQHLSAEPVAASRHNLDVGPDLDRLLSDLLAKSPDDRPSSAAAVRGRLEQIRDAPPGRAVEAEALENPLEGLAGGVFVGREEELSELRAAADEALGARAQLVLLAGEPGIGKTRTAEEVATYARLRGANVHWGRCHEGEGAPPYWPWVQAIRSYVREADPVALAWEMGAGATEIARVVPEIAERIGDAGALDPAEDEQARFKLFDAIAGFLANASASRPLVVVLDDLHWADEPSLLLLEFIARGLSSSSLLVVGTYRDVELGRHHPLSRVLGDLSGLERSRRVVLRGLGEDDIASYVQRSAGTEASGQLVAEVHRQTEGNPFFVGEVVRLLASEGRLQDGTGARMIPQGVRDVVGRRLDRLSPAANEALRSAAAIGRDFDEEALARIADLDRAELDAALGEAVEAQFLDERRDDGRYRFAHALVRETLYEELSAAQRPALHSRIAATLEELYAAEPGRTDRRLAELAHHFNEAAAAGDPVKAVDYAERAARQARGQLGYEEAAEHYARALEAADLAGIEPRRRCLLLLDLGETRMRGGHFDEARETLEEAAELAGDLRDPELMTRAAVGVSFTAEVGRFDEKVAELISAALEAVGPGDSPPRAILLSWLAQDYYWVDPQGRSADLHAEAIAMARRLGDEGTLAHALSRANFIDISPDAVRRGVETNTEIIALARKVRDRELELRSHVLRLNYHLALGDIPAVDRDLDTYVRLATELRQPSFLWHIPILRGMRAMIDGRFEEAEELALEARAGGERAGEPLAQQFFAIQALTIYRHQGRLAEIADAVDDLAKRYPAIPAWSVVRAAVLPELGRIDEARAAFEQLAESEFSGIPLDAQWTIAHALLTEAAFQLGDAERSRLLRERLAPWRGLVIVAGRSAASRGPVSRYLGIAAETAGDNETAIADYEDAIAMSRRMGDRPFMAESSIDLARVLLGRDGDGDGKRAAELLDTSLDAAQRLRMAGTSERALALKLQAQGLSDIDVDSTIDDVIGAVEQERPDIRSYAAPDGSVTILFSDIESSTAMTERLGDERWLQVLRDHNAVFREKLSSYGGYEVKNQGDGFMLVFPSPVGALRCAIEVQRAFEERAAERPDERIRVRIGLHTGEAIAEEGDFFGRNVILAARIAAQARGGEILVSEALYEQCGVDEGIEFSESRELELKGLAGSHTVHRADWQRRGAAVGSF